MNFIGRYFSRFIYCSICAGAFAIFSFEAGAVLKEGIAAIVDKSVITLSELKSATQVRAALIARDPNMSNEEKIRLIKKAEDESLKDLVERELVIAEFKNLGAQISPDYVEEDIRRIIKEKFDGNETEFRRELGKAKMSIDKFRDQRRKSLIVQAMKARSIKGLPPLTPRDINSAYAENKEKFRGESSVRVHTIAIPQSIPNDLITVEDQRRFAQEIRDKLAEGGDFARMARTYSADAYRSQGGDRGVLKMSQISGIFKQIVEQQQVGKVSEVIDFKPYFLILYISERKVGKAAPLSEVKEQVRKLALQKQRRQKYEKWLTRLREKYHVKVISP